MPRHADAENISARRAQEDVARRTVGRDPSAGEQNGSFSPCGGALKVVHNGQNGNAVSARFVENAKEVELMAHVEMSRRLVEQQHLGLLRQAARQGSELPLSRRERTETTPRKVGDLGPLERVGDGRIVVRAQPSERSAVRIPAEGHALAHCEQAAACVLGRHERDDTRDRGTAPKAKISIQKPDLSGACGKQPGDRADQRRLAGGVGPDESDGFSGAKRQPDPGEDALAAAIHGNIVRFDDRSHSRPSLPRSATRK
jgi:hypothetical protein